MRAKLIFEKFEDESDPIKDMHIGFGKKALTQGFKILEFINSKGKEGASFTEIQHFIWTKLKHFPEADFWKKEKDQPYFANYRSPGDSSGNLRVSRGYWADGLYGAAAYKGLLRAWCKKDPKTKKWVLVKFPKPGESLFPRW